jgi:protein-S-isoprenylcysteine O-methyltransferase Ste14
MDPASDLRFNAGLGMLLATLAGWTWWPLAIAAVLFFVAGTEIRLRAEEGLLAERFLGEFAAYRRSTWAYIPLIR